MIRLMNTYFWYSCHTGALHCTSDLIMILEYYQGVRFSPCLQDSLQSILILTGGHYCWNTIREGLQIQLCYLYTSVIQKEITCIMQACLRSKFQQLCLYYLCYQPIWLHRLQSLCIAHFLCRIPDSGMIILLFYFAIYLSLVFLTPFLLL